MNNIRLKLPYTLVKLGYEALITFLVEEFIKLGVSNDILGEISYDREYLTKLIFLWENNDFLRNNKKLYSNFSNLPKEENITKKLVDEFVLEVIPYDLTNTAIRSNLLGEVIKNNTKEELIVSFNLCETLELKESEENPTDNKDSLWQWRKLWKINDEYTAEYLSKNFIFSNGCVCGEVVF